MDEKHPASISIAIQVRTSYDFNKREQKRKEVVVVDRELE